MRRARCLLALAVVLAAISQTAAQIRAPPGKGPKAHARREDLPYIKCQACELLAKNAYAQAQALLARPPVGGRLVDEMAVIEAVEKLTTAWREEGQWITRLDLVESGPRLLVKEVASSQLGDCGVECKTVERALQDIMGEHDADVGEALFTNKRSAAQFKDWLCTELTAACKGAPPPLPKGRVPGPAWAPADPDDSNLEKMMGEMNDQGLRGQVYSREELLQKYAMEDPMRPPKGEDDDEDDEDEDGGGGGAGESSAAGAGRGPAQAGVGEQLRQGLAEAGKAAGRGLRSAAARAKGLWGSLATRQGAGPKKSEL